MTLSRSSLVASGLLALALACSGGGHGSSNGSLTVRMVDGPINGYTEINLNIQKVEVNSDASGWMTISSPNETINLLTLTGGVSATLANGATLPAGHYNQMRLILGSGNTLKLADGTVVDLTTPSAMQSGVKLIFNFDVAAGTTKDVVIDFDAAHSIQVTQTGASTKYILRPTIRAVDVTATGSISGTLTDSAGAPLAGAEVTAQTLDSLGKPAVIRSVFTGADGHYTLDLLPTGGSFYVVSQPVVGGQAYTAKASGAFAVTSATPTFTYSTSFTAAATVGSVTGAITPVATAADHDVVDLLQALAPGGTGSATFIVRSQVAAVATATETYTFASVPTGSYQAQATRYTLASDGTTTVHASAPMTLTVNASLATTVNFSF